MKRTVALFVILSCCAIFSTAAANPVKTFTVITENFAQAPGINPGATNRRPGTITAILDAARTSDVVCATEVWRDLDVTLISNLLKKRGLNVFSVDTRGQNETGNDHCEGSTWSAIQACGEKNCAHLPNSEYTFCSWMECPLELVMLYTYDKPCFTCVASGVGMSGQEIKRRCNQAPGMTRMYDGSNGLLMISKHPLTKMAYTAFKGSSVNRGVQEAVVNKPGQKPVRVLCTHLSSDQQLPPVNASFDSWEEEHEAQVKILLKTARGDIIAGDFNTGPAIGASVRAELPRSWQMFTRAQYWSPVVQTAKACTLCAGNTLRIYGVNGHYELRTFSTAIDHVLLHRSSDWKVLGVNVREPAKVRQCVKWKGRRCTRRVMRHRTDHRRVTVTLHKK